jgi:hypothetical protein
MPQVLSAGKNGAGPVSGDATGRRLSPASEQMMNCAAT